MINKKNFGLFLISFIFVLLVLNSKNNVLIDNQNSGLVIAQSPDLSFYDIYEIIEDDLVSDNDGNVDAGETIEMRLRLENTGDQDATDVYANISTSDPFVELTTDLQSYVTIPSGNLGLSSSFYIFNINSSCSSGHIIIFSITINSTEGIWEDSFTVTVIGKPQPSYYTYHVYSEVDGDLISDNDGVFDPGEIIGIRLYVINKGDANLLSVIGILNESDPYATIHDDNGDFGTIEGNEGISFATFGITVSGACPDKRNISLSLIATDSFNVVWKMDFTIIINGTQDFQILEVIYTEQSGDGDEYIDAGETWNVFANLKNNGTAPAYSVIVFFTSSDIYVSFYRSSSYRDRGYGTMGEGEEKIIDTSSYWRFTVSDEAPRDHLLNFSFKVWDNSEQPNWVFYENRQVVTGYVDNTAPTCSNLNYPQEVFEGETIVISLKVWDDSGVRYVQLLYKTKYGDWNYQIMSESGGYYSTTIGPFDKGTEITFLFVACDIHGNCVCTTEFTFKIKQNISSLFLKILLWGAISIGSLIFLKLIFKRLNKMKISLSDVKSALNQRKKKAKEKREIKHKMREQKKQLNEISRQQKERERLVIYHSNEKVLLNKFEKILRMSERVKIDDTAVSLGLNKKQLFERLIDWQESLAFKLDGGMIVVENINDFIKSLEKQFTEWEVIETVAAGDIKKLQAASFACFYCGKEIDRSKTDGDIICSSCGKEAFSCSICMKHISYNEETVKDPNCGNLFHRRHIIEWLKVQGTCPLCNKRINEKSLKTFTRSNK